MTASYVPIFSPHALASDGVAATALALGDRAPTSVYVFTDEITLAVNVALATGRPPGQR